MSALAECEYGITQTGLCLNNNAMSTQNSDHIFMPIP